VEVHVPQAGDQELASGVDDPGARRGLGARAYRKNPSTADGDGDVLARWRAGSVNDRRMLDDNILPRDNRKEGSQSKQPVAQAILTCLLQISYSASD
jgi:hypothetical protein